DCYCCSYTTRGTFVF
nr:immunoglobulin light chain junction region [Macaca mulatta]